MEATRLSVTLGWALDAASYPGPGDSAAASMGRLVVGPLGFVRLLERHLGLGGPEAAEPLRIAAYHAAAVRVGAADRFYSASLAQDSWSTARTLLNWRDELALGGWKGQAHGAPERIAQLAEIEGAAGAALPAGLVERLSAALSEIERGRAVPLERIDLVDPLASWPSLWQRVVTALETRGAAVRRLEFPRAADAGDLGALQRFLQEGARGKAAGDGSLVALDADNELDAAEAVADWLAAAPDRNGDVVVIRSGGSGILDGELKARHLPIAGVASRSPWRAGLQALSLAMETQWEPFDPARTLEFLGLPKSPLAGYAGFAFARAVQRQPGRDGRIWIEARTDALARRKRQLEERGESAAKVGRKVRRLEEDIDFWLPAKRCAADVGMPADLATEVCARIVRWASAQSATGDDPVLASAAIQASTLADVISRSGLAVVPRSTLNRMIDAAVGAGVAIEANEAEASRWHLVDGPEHVLRPVETIVWWGFTNTAANVASSPWTRDELAWFEANAVSPEAPRARLERDRAAYARGACMASRRLLLVMPRSVRGQPADPHPLWGEVRAALDVDASGGPTRASTVALQASLPAVGDRSIRKAPVVPLDLPAPARAWHIPAGAVAPEERASPTSIEKLLGCSFAWVLDRHAKIRQSPFLGLPGPELVMGNLCHLVVERLFGEQVEWAPEAAGRRAGEMFDELLPQMAATLLQPGVEVERSRNRAHVVRAVRRLVEHLAQAGLKVVAVEKSVARPMGDGWPELTGKIDLLLGDASGAPVVLDLKWTNALEFRRSQLAEGKPVQLAAYAWLVADAGTAPVEAGFFMLKQARILFSASAPFAGAHVPGTDMSRTWQAARESYRVAAAGLTAGAAVAAGVGEPAEGEPMLPLALEPPCRICDYGSLCGQKGTSA